MNGSQTEEYGQERGDTGWIGRKMGMLWNPLELLKNGWFFVCIFCF